MRRLALPGALNGRLIAVMPSCLLIRFLALVMPSAVLMLGRRYLKNPMVLYPFMLDSMRIQRPQVAAMI